jgi:hypothetical protein
MEYKSWGFNPDQSKGQSRLETELTKAPEAIFILGSSAYQKGTGQRRRLKTGSYADNDFHGLISGGKARILAGRNLAKTFPDATIVPLSIFPAKGDNPEINLASVASGELQRLKVPKEKIVAYPESYSTLTELMAVITLTVQNNWKTIVILTNEHQRARAQKMLEILKSLKDNNPHYLAEWTQHNMDSLLPQFEKLNPTVTFVSAESVLAQGNPRYANLFKKAFASDAYLKRQQTEEKALIQLNDGTYGTTPHSTFITPKSQ